MWTCDYSSSYKGSSTKHICSVHNAKKSFKCDICDHSFSKKSNLKKHIGKVHEIKKHFTCNQSYLQKESSLKSYLKRHMLSVHDEKTKLFKCSICEALVLKKSTSGYYFYVFFDLVQNHTNMQRCFFYI